MMFIIIVNGVSISLATNFPARHLGPRLQLTTAFALACPAASFNNNKKERNPTTY
jgi:hypothetical protein